MKLWKASAVAALTSMALVVSGCQSEGKDEAVASSSTAASSSSSTSAAVPALPTVDELNATLARAIDPAIPLEEKVKTVQGGENAPELFDRIAKAKEESGADFHVVDPVLPGYAEDTVVTSVVYTAPDREPTTMDNVEFVFEEGQWKLSQRWACTLVRATVTPEEIPAMCAEEGDAGTAPAPAPADGAAPADAPAPVAPAPAGEAPAPAEAPAQ